MGMVASGWDNARPSTTWVWKKVKMSSAPAGEGQRAKRSASAVQRYRDRWKPQHLIVQYRGGPESSWLLSCGVETRRFPGYIALEDAMKWLLEDAAWLK